MRVKDIASMPGLALLQGRGDLETVVSGGYTGDLLSDVMGHASAGRVWLTCQTHENIIAVAKLKNLAGIIIVNGRRPGDDVLARAGEERIPVFGTSAAAFETGAALSERIRAPKDR